MFLPFGILVPARFHRMRNPLFCVDAGFLASCFLEFAQLVTQRGYCQLTISPQILWGRGSAG